MKRCFPPYVSKERQIKTAMSYFYTSLGIAKFLKHWQYLMLTRMRNNGNCHSLLRGIQNDAVAMEDNLAVSYQIFFLNNMLHMLFWYFFLPFIIYFSKHFSSIYSYSIFIGKYIVFCLLYHVLLIILIVIKFSPL